MLKGKRCHRDDLRGGPLRFKTRLIVGYATLLVVTFAIGVTVLFAMSSATSQLEAVARDLGTDAIAIHRLHYRTEYLVATSRGYLLTGDPETLKRFDREASQIDDILGQM